MKLLKQNNLVTMYILCIITLFILLGYWLYELEDNITNISYNYSNTVSLDPIVIDNVITSNHNYSQKINDNMMMIRLIGNEYKLLLNDKSNETNINDIEYEEPKEEKDVSYTRYVTELLNVRSKPNINSNVLGKLKIKTEVNVIGEVVGDNWVKIKFKDNEGYVCSDYLVDSVDGIENFTYNWDWAGPKLNKYSGWVKGPSGKETYYNLDMSRIVRMMQSKGFGEYWVRSDGAKMLGNYVMVAANLAVHPRGSLVETSLGTGVVCDTGTFAYSNPNQIDTAVTWVK